MLFRDVGQRHRVANSGIGEHDVDVSGFLLHNAIEAIEVGDLGHIGLHASGVSADLVNRRVQFRFATANHEDACALPGEAFGGRQADAAVCAGNDGDFPFEPTHEFLQTVAREQHGRRSTQLW